MEGGEYGDSHPDMGQETIALSQEAERFQELEGGGGESTKNLIDPNEHIISDSPLTKNKSGLKSAANMNKVKRKMINRL